MRKRYERDAHGRMRIQARIYTKEEHSIIRSEIDKRVVETVNSLSRAGFEAYIVGGAIRDLLLDRKPKDFDVVTNARPDQVVRLFKNSRVIGRRFRLVHVFFPAGYIVEVATFRSLSHSPEIIYGSLSDDAKRRDFSLNGLYYQLENEEIYDFVNAMRDIKHKVMHSIIPLENIFIEDPVRILRCLKFASFYGFRIPLKITQRIQHDAPLIAQCPFSRLSEEMVKILQCGHSYNVLQSFQQHRVLKYLLPQLSNGKKRRTPLLEGLQILDKSCFAKGTPRLSLALSYLLAELSKKEDWKSVCESGEQLFLRFKELLQPLTFPNIELLEAITILARQHKIHLDLNQLLKQKWLRSKRSRLLRNQRVPLLKKSTGKNRYWLTQGKLHTARKHVDTKGN